MSKRRKNPNSKLRGTESRYQEACRLAAQGQHKHARNLFKKLRNAVADNRLKAMIVNDLAVLQAVGGEKAAAKMAFQEALAIHAECQPARANLALLEEDFANELTITLEEPDPPVIEDHSNGKESAVKVAIVSFLFNWPSTGGGIVHTVELARLLARAGFDVRHFYARYPGWEIGRVEKQLDFPSEVLEFNDSAWNLTEIQNRYRQAVASFNPDYVIITDSWNMKPLLAEAVHDYRYILRLQAMECLCPLNNIRLLPEDDGQLSQCPLHQFANARECAGCIKERGKRSGGLHQVERALSGAGTPEYHEKLLRAFREAEVVLVVNPLHEAMLSPFTKSVRVVTAGMDPARFPWPWPDETRETNPGRLHQILFAGLIEESIKGFHVLQEACALLWQRRQDFEVVATADPPGRFNDFTRFVGWQSQEDLPRHLRAADILAMPTIAQEALGRTAVEAMAAGRPVVASRLGGLPFTVVDGATGLLFEPGNAMDLARRIETLLDDTDLRKRMGRSGRRRFEEHYSWNVIIDRHYKPLLAPCKHVTRDAKPAAGSR